MTEALSLEGVSKRYGEISALKKTSFAVEEGQVFGIVGPSGAGKSTLLRLVDLLEPPTEGKILVEGKQVSALSKHADSVRRSMGMVLQKPVVLNRSVANNLGYPLMIRGWDEEDIQKVVSEQLKLLGLDKRRESNARNLSGGEMQRLCFARATIHGPKLLLLDEFAANLDPSNVARLEQQVREYIDGGPGRTVVIVTHNMFQARRMCTRVALMWGGEIVEIAETKKFFEDPRDSRTAAFVNGESVY